MFFAGWSITNKMGAASSKQGRYVVNPDSLTSDPRNFDPNTPSRAKAYRVIRSPEAVLQKDNVALKTPQVATSVRYHTYPEGYSTHNVDKFYTPSNSPESEHGRLNSEFYTPSVKSVVSPSAETLTCTAPLDRRQAIRTSNHSQDSHSGGVDNDNPDGYHVTHSDHSHEVHDRENNQLPRPHIGHNGHQIYSEVNKMAKKDHLSSDHKNNNIHHPDSHQMAPNGQRLYMSVADHPRKQRVVVDSVVQLQEDGKTVTHFLPYTTSTPLHQGFESTSLFIPYITSTPNRQYQVVPQTPPQPPTPLPPPLPPTSHSSKRDSAGDNQQQSPGSFTILDALFLVGSMAMYIADIVLDILVTVQYFQAGKTLWSGMTMAFIIIPSITLQYFSLRWHFADTLEAVEKKVR